MKPSEEESVFLPHGGYRKLRSYKVAEAVYDATVVFCRRFFAHDRRMADQMDSKCGVATNCSLPHGGIGRRYTYTQRSVEKLEASSDR